MAAPTWSRATDSPVPPQVADVVAELLDRRRIPGLALAVTNQDGLLYTYNAGARTIAPPAPVDSSTDWLWFSMSKVVTATAAMRLADEGRIDLDAPLTQYLLPSGHLADVPVATVRQLLSHTAGIANPMPLRWVRPADAPAGDDALFDRLLPKTLSPRRSPGARASYSNVGYLILGRVIENVAGEPFRQHVERNVLTPSGMTTTGYTYDVQRARATGYVRGPRALDPLLRRVLPAGVVGDRQEGQLALRPFLVEGAAYGGLVGPVADVARFARLHLNDGEIDGTRILSTDAAREMRELRWKGKRFDHGLGWFRRPTSDRHRSPYVEHYGAGAGFWNAIRLYPEQGLGMAVMANTTQPYDVDVLFESVRASVPTAGV